MLPIDNLGDIGFILEADFDMNVGYTFPWYTELENLIIRFKPVFRLGGLIHTAFHLYFVRLHLYVDLLASEMTIADFIGKINIVDYSEVCAKIDASNENVRFKING